MSSLLRVTDLKKSFQISSSRPGGPKQLLRAVDGISFEIQTGETLGLVGESGCGKSTTGKLLLRLLEADSGSIEFRGQPLLTLPKKQVTELRREMQMIFQDPFSSLNPRMRVGEIIGEPLLIHNLAKKVAVRDRVVQLMQTVGLTPDHYNRYAHEFSGGQRQRIGIARTLAVQPSLIIADEPISALDLSIQAQIINLLQDIQQEFSLTYLFISHDLGVIEHVCDRVAVMYLGRIVELASARELYRSPLHPYTEALLNAVPVPDPNRIQKTQLLAGETPSPINPPQGCHFHPRCPYAGDICHSTYPVLETLPSGRQVACHFTDQVNRPA